MTKDNIWQTKKIGDICETSSGGTPSRKNKSFYEGKIPWVKSGELNFNTIRDTEEKITDEAISGSSAKIFQKGTLLIALYGATVGKLAFLGLDAATNQAVCAIMPENGLDKEYLYWYLFSIKKDLVGKSIGGAQPNISQTILKDVDVPIPPLPAQHHIVDKIEELFSDLNNGIENLKKAKKQLETYKQAVLKAAFEGKLTKDWREQEDYLPTPEDLKQDIAKEQKRYRQQQLEEWEQEVEEWKEEREPGKKPRKPMKGRTFDPLDEELKNLPELPNNWDWIRISDTVSRVEYGTSQKSEDSGEVPVLRMGNMQSGKFVWDDLVYSNDSEEIEKYLLEPGDVLFNRTNSLELVGKTALYKGKHKAIFAGYLIRLNQIDTIVDARYLNYYLNSYEAKNYGNKVKTDGVNQSNINGTKLSGYPFPYTSVKEQKKISDELDSRLSIVDQNKKTIEQELQKAKALRQSILQKAFEGRLIDQVEKPEISDVSISKFQQMQMIGYLIEVLQKNDQMKFGELVLVKYMYLIDRVYNYRTGFKFKKYNHGPYDPNFKKLLYTRSNFFTRKDPGYFKVTSVKRNQLLNKKSFNTKAFKEAVNSISKFTRKFYPKGIAGKKLELLTTVCKIIEDYQSVDLKMIRKEMANWEIEDEDFNTKAEKFSRVETERCLEFIIRKKWNDRLIKTHN